MRDGKIDSLVLDPQSPGRKGATPLDVLERSAGPGDHWTSFPEEGWYYDALGNNRVSMGAVRGVRLYNPERMPGGFITWLEIADLFRPRVQSSLFRPPAVGPSGLPP